MTKANIINDYVNYRGRTVLKEGFRAFVYGKDDNKKLVNSWNEYQDAIGSGFWFADKPPLKQRKKERIDDGTDS